MVSQTVKVRAHARDVNTPRFSWNDPINTSMDVAADKITQLPGQAYETLGKGVDAIDEHERLVNLFLQPAGELTPLELEEAKALRTGKHPDTRLVMLEVKARVRASQKAREITRNVARTLDSLASEATARARAYARKTTRGNA